MDQDQLTAVLLAGYLLVVAIAVVLYFRGSRKGRQTWSTFDPKQRRLGVVYLTGFVLWFGSALAVRPWAAAIGLEGHWTLGAAPSLFAGVTVTAFIAFKWRLRAIAAFASGTAPMVLIEVVQLWLPSYVFDPLDVLAGISAAALVAMLLVDTRSAPMPSISGTRVGSAQAPDKQGG